MYTSQCRLDAGKQALAYMSNGFVNTGDHFAWQLTLSSRIFKTQILTTISLLGICNICLLSTVT